MNSEEKIITADDESTPQRMQIFRHVDGKSVIETGTMSMAPSPPEVVASMKNAYAHGFGEGGKSRAVFSSGGISLTHVWFKANYPLPLHRHDGACLYYIIAGTLRLGTVTLHPRDGFFLPANTPYTYKPGDQGVELLEFRVAEKFNFESLMDTVKFWDKAAAISAENREAWSCAAPPDVERLAP